MDPMYNEYGALTQEARKGLEDDLVKTIGAVFDRYPQYNVRDVSHQIMHIAMILESERVMLSSMRQRAVARARQEKTT